MSAPKEARRIALLLNSLGDDLAEAAISSMNTPNAGQVRVLLKEFSETPPRQEETNRVLDEFESFMRFALQTANAPTALTDQLFQESKPDGDESDDGGSGGTELRIFTPSDDPIFDLQKLTAAQIAGAVKNEHVQTIGLILSCLPKELFAETVDLLPQEKQSDAFFASQQGASVNQELLNRIAQKTVEKAALIEPTGASSEDLDQNTAELLRALPKKTRKRLMEELEQADAERATRLQELLYVFEDVATYDNRSIQKLLGQADTEVLVMALQGADQEIADRIFDNLSKRASSALQEEMEFRQASSSEEVSAARNQFAKLIAKLDQSGELTEQ